MQRALALLERRGPDDGGQLVEVHGATTVSLLQRRLSVIDTSSGGHQPMDSADGRFSVVLNGEIYNYIELREELLRLGAQFRSRSDTEVFLSAWAQWEESALQRCIGMFAFAILDRHTGTLTCGRDPFGIKPLYYTQSARGLSFASELAALQSLREEPARLHWQRAYDYLSHGDYDSSPDTFYRDVRQLPSGHILRMDLPLQNVQLHRWWRPKTSPVSALSREDAAVALREKFLRSVRLHMRSDVALGAALSGGLDSSAIVCAMRYLEPDLPIHTFSFIAADSNVSEEKWVDVVCQHVGARSHKVVIEASDLARDIDDLIAAQGEPFGSTSIYAQYRVFKLAREQGVTVTLDGQGADELLAGYHGYPGSRIRSLLEQGAYGQAVSFLRQWSRWPGRSLAGGMQAALAACTDGPLHAWLREVKGTPRRPAWLHAGPLAEEGVMLRFPGVSRAAADKGRRVVAEMSEAVSRNGLPALLRHGDRNSMRFSVESRVPFLTPDLADFLLTLPEDYLIAPTGETKSILRSALHGIVPKAILERRDKIGFATPEQRWLVQIAPQAREWLREETGLPFLDQGRMLQEFDALIAGRRPFSWQAWRWINFVCWYNRHMAH